MALDPTPWPLRTYTVYLEPYCSRHAHSCQSTWGGVEVDWVTEAAVGSHAVIFGRKEQPCVTLYIVKNKNKNRIVSAEGSIQCRAEKHTLLHATMMWIYFSLMSSVRDCDWKFSDHIKVTYLSNLPVLTTNASNTVHSKFDTTVTPPASLLEGSLSFSGIKSVKIPRLGCLDGSYSGVPLQRRGFMWRLT